MGKLANAAIALFVVAVLLMAAAVVILRDQVEAAHSKAVVFDTYTHAILCDSLLLDLTELKKAKDPSIVATVKLMIHDDCPGTQLP